MENSWFVCNGCWVYYNIFSVIGGGESGFRATARIVPRDKHPRETVAVALPRAYLYRGECEAAIIDLSRDYIAQNLVREVRKEEDNR